ncbi:hypothetical protein LXL04_038364 [Taraxacum kok-saghyz]
MESHPVIAADMESHHQAAASEIHKELTFNRPKTEISAECEIEMDLPTGLKESSPSRQKSESSPSTQKSTPTAMKFKTEISADCEIEKNENHQERDPDLVNRYVAKMKKRQKHNFNALKLKSKHAAEIMKNENHQHTDQQLLNHCVDDRKRKRELALLTWE